MASLQAEAYNSGAARAVLLQVRPGLNYVMHDPSGHDLEPASGKGRISMYAAIRQGKAKAGMAEELTRRIKEGAIPIISDVDGFIAYYVVYAPDDTVTAISIFNNHAGAAESNRRGLAWIERDLMPLLVGPATAVAGPVIVHTLA
jgi:hypothetical protein